MWCGVANLNVIETDQVDDLKNVNGVVVEVDIARHGDEDARQRIHALDVVLAYLKEQMAETRVAAEYGVGQVAHVVDEELGKASRYEIQVAARLAHQLVLDARALQQLHAHGYALDAQLRVHVVEQQRAEYVRHDGDVWRRRGLQRHRRLGAHRLAAVLVEHVRRAVAQRVAGARRAELVLQAHDQHADYFVVVLDQQTRFSVFQSSHTHTHGSK